MCFCTPTKRTPVCEGCPHDIQIKWGLKKEKKQMNCDTSMPMPCECRCHSSGIKQMFATNPPIPCCMCEALTYAPVKQKTDIEYLLEKIEKLELLNPEHQIKRIAQLESENKMRKDTIACVDSAYDKATRELDQDLGLALERIDKLEASLKYAQQNLTDACGKIEKIEDYLKKQSELPSIDCGEINKVIDRINKFEDTVGKRPHKCPVCHGEGGYYIGGVMDSECRSCESKGVLWG